MPDVRLAFVREDEPVAEALAEAFDAAGMSVDGDPDEALDDVGAVVLVWSDAAYSSDAFRGAARRAVSAGKAVVANVEGDPPEFEAAPTIDLRSWDGDPGDPQLGALTRAVRRQSDTAPAPPPPPVVAPPPPRRQPQPPAPVAAQPPPRRQAPPPEPPAKKAPASKSKAREPREAKIRIESPKGRNGPFATLLLLALIVVGVSALAYGAREPLGAMLQSTMARPQQPTLTVNAQYGVLLTAFEMAELAPAPELSTPVLRLPVAAPPTRQTTTTPARQTAPSPARRRLRPAEPVPDPVTSWDPVHPQPTQQPRRRGPPA